MQAVTTETLNCIEQWDDFVTDRYDPNSKTEDFRKFDDSAPAGVREFYPGHREGAYDYLMNGKDRTMFEWVRKFNPYDLYSKSSERPKLADVKPYYDDLVAEYFPKKIAW